MALASVSSEQGQARGRRAFLVLGAIALIVVAAIAAYAFYASGRESTDDAVVEFDVVPVTARVGGVVA